MRDSFIFYRSFYEAIKILPRDVQGEIYTAIMEYSLYGNETENLKPIARSLFTLMKPILETNNVRYENGKKGGSRRRNVMDGATEAEPNMNQDATEAEPNMNQDATKAEPNVNQDATKAEPNVNQDATKAEPNKDVDKDVEESTSNEVPKKAGLSSPPDYNEVMSVFNKTFSGKLPRVEKMTERRRVAVKSRVAEYGADAVGRAFAKVLASPFLLGRNDRGWRADFDWIFSPGNFTKVLEGTYDDRGAPGMPGQRLHTDDDQKIIDKLGF